MLCLTSFTGYPRKMDVAEFSNWVMSSNSGLQDRISIDAYDYIVSYLPNEFIALQQLKGKKVDKKLFSEKYKELQDVEYYTLILNLNNNKKNVVESLSQEFGVSSDQVVKYLAYDLQHFVRLIHDGDTLSSMFLHMEETYEVTSYVKVMMMFERSSKKEGDRELLISFPWLDRELKFTVQEESLKNIPKVIIK